MSSAHEDRHELVVVGGGASGLAASFFAARRSVSTLLIEQQSPGGRLTTIGVIDDYPVMAASTTGPALATLMTERARSAGVEFAFEEVRSLRSSEAGWLIATERRVIETVAVVLATGGLPAHLGIHGEEEFLGRGVSTCATCDGPIFSGGCVVVVGAGDVALSDAIALAEFARSVILIQVAAEPRPSRHLRERLERLENVQMFDDAHPTAIVGEGSVSGLVIERRLRDVTEELPCDAVFVALPRAAGTTLVQVGDDPFDLSAHDVETRLAGLFVAGEVRTGPTTIASCVSDGEVAATYAAAHLGRSRGEEIPSGIGY